MHQGARNIFFEKICVRTELMILDGFSILTVKRQGKSLGIHSNSLSIIIISALLFLSLL